MDEILERIWERKLVFFSTFFLVFTLSYIILLALDFLPEPPTVEVEDVSVQTEIAEEVEDIVESSAEITEDTTNQIVTDTETEAVTSAGYEAVTPVSPVVVSDGAILPTQIYIEKLGKTVPVLNPTSRTIAELDNALLSGVVRHPDSATLDQQGNVFILGHSSYLPKVFNKNFQAFNGIQNLVWGDIIEVMSNDTVFRYRVENVYRAKAQDATVPIAGTGHMLTLATCNSFGSVDDRYIVEAKLIGEHSR